MLQNDTNVGTGTLGRLSLAGFLLDAQTRLAVRVHGRYSLGNAIRLSQCLVIARQGFPLAIWFRGQHLLVVLPRSIHEIPVLLALSIVRAFSHRFRLRLSVSPPFGLGVPQ